MDQTIEVIKIALLVIAAVFTYWKFFREGSHLQRIEMDLDFIDLGVRNNERLIEVGVLLENKGNVEQRLKEIVLRIRGIDSKDSLEELEKHKPRIKFGHDDIGPSIIKPKKEGGFFFIRPKIRQRFPMVVKVPSTWSHLHIRAKFEYKGVKNFHTSERAFAVPGNETREST